MNIASVKIKTSPILMMRLSLSQTIQAGSGCNLMIMLHIFIYQMILHSIKQEEENIGEIALPQMKQMVRMYVHIIAAISDY